jgi:hypothetical protein
MNPNEMPAAQMKEPLAELEKELINAYVAGAGQEFQTLLARNDKDARRLLTDASLYATARLTEIETRSHYLRSLRGEP